MKSNTTAVNPSESDALPILQNSEIRLAQQIPWGSNHTFLVQIDAGSDNYIKAIYKPRDGERPLVDFPHGTLYKREYATFLIGRALGWPRVPLTVIREGPYGIGSVQLYVPSNPNVTYFDLLEKNTDELRRFAIFDVVVNNYDRKGGHCLHGKDGRIWSIDHGLTFHSIFKMRTVMLEYSEEPIPNTLLKDLETLGNCLESKHRLIETLDDTLTGNEIAALKNRLYTLLEQQILPKIDPRYNLPWPLV